ncbi:hypothetical protein B9G69_014620 [Bdellovibrio sp. SKB1291214]|uniref:hypothetical protein n=1 Tax=Bdellovibrio sp. SKB1291214 TaxID=1732569 RepID=UPI000B6D25A5|nr:hypothetical protein [Bdellovibrio sp. SKB1291214]UYL08275.1 hypothetical protein B9G69_014620 [Bdellovibrio sp. SKB1291214]
MKLASTKNSFISYLTLFSSAGTLICCALPALFVSLGLGAVLAGLASKMPALIWISEHKIEVFVFAAVMLGLNGYWTWRNRNAPCPLDPELRDACTKARRFSFVVYVSSVVIYIIGATFAFVIPLL